MRTFIRLEIFLITLMLISFFSCQEEDNEAVSSGSKHKQLDKTQIGDGNMSLWLQSDKQGKPEKLSIVFSKKAFDNLPHSEDHMANEFVLKLDKATLNLPYDHVAVNWNPHGHPPANIYDRPHFDFHYYTISEQERHMIAPGDAKLNILPGTEYLPEGYFPTDAVPMMGMHWVDPTSPELGGATFTHTFIYGSYNGGIAFLEPMITLEYIQSKPNQKFSIKQPAAFEKEGYYPTEYGIFYDAQKDEYNITVENFIYREAN
ncbi:DUF5602 domain-containing protein [Catalinimonas sp. 4WD22]|uniref:DUF5602 domain-containing protein n=1 Tax=Catalinimonas locisalis TaxID=3133978 RepID=UPI0031010EDB